MPFVRCLVGFYAFMDIQQSDYRKTESAEILRAFSPEGVFPRTFFPFATTVDLQRHVKPRKRQ
jgi:hypothetical protein